MATFIKVTQEGSQLLRRNAQQTQAARLGKIEADERAKTQQQVKAARQQALLRQGLDSSGAAVGEQRRRRFRPDEPAATANPLVSFGFVDAYDTYLTYLEGADPDPLYNARSLIPAETGNLRNYKVVRVMIQGRNGSCVSGDPSLTIPLFFGYRQTQFAEYVRSGGVLWINTEFSSCGHSSAIFDAFLADVFGSSMTTNGTIYSGDEEYIESPFFNYVQKYQLAYAPLAGTAPAVFYTEATALVQGGTPLYVNNLGYCPIAFERIGNGYLVLSGDSDGSTYFPSYSANGKTLVEALLALQRLRP